MKKSAKRHPFVWYFLGVRFVAGGRKGPKRVKGFPVPIITVSPYVEFAFQSKTGCFLLVICKCTRPGNLAEFLLGDLKPLQVEIFNTCPEPQRSIETFGPCQDSWVLPAAYFLLENFGDLVICSEDVLIDADSTLIISMK